MRENKKRLPCIIYADTIKENMSYVWIMRFVFVSSCFGFVMKIKPLFEEMALLFRDYNITEQDVVVGRSRFEQFYFIPSADIFCTRRMRDICR